jgi:protein involved in polysaccharide export with SLBB domain
VVLFRPQPDDKAEARTLDIKKLLKTRELSEDLRLRAGDIIFVPQSTISKVRKYLPLPTTGVYLNPTPF